MEAFFVARGYPHDLITRARLRAEEKQRADVLVTTPGSNCTAADRQACESIRFFRLKFLVFFSPGET